jgi:hypothetical protein
MALRRRSEIGRAKRAAQSEEQGSFPTSTSTDLVEASAQGMMEETWDEFSEGAIDPDPTVHPPAQPTYAELATTLQAVSKRVDEKLASGQLPVDTAAYPQPAAKPPPPPPQPAMTAYPAFVGGKYEEGLQPGDKPAPVDRSPPKREQRDEPKLENRVSDSPDFNRLVETVLKELDLESEYAELEALLEIGDNRRDFATLMEEVDKADRRALRANALWANAVIVYEGLKLDQREVDAHLWSDAKKALEEEEQDEDPEEPTADGKKPVKRRKAAKKTLTNADVDAKIAELYPDEWRGGKMRLKRAELAVERTEAFSKRWAERVKSLNTMLASCRKS